ncbi:hypothetical protein [Noviherbaspirillum aerium]|uniref:hypothetical protein n=1 Tax=Noviherbaspirillum aerium TaxID=2588497 RepID=UPI00124C6DFF|nr:hypothetical protein [Noviherbaspirillum aerium]
MSCAQAIMQARVTSSMPEATPQTSSARPSSLPLCTWPSQNVPAAYTSRVSGSCSLPSRDHRRLPMNVAGSTPTTTIISCSPSAASVSPSRLCTDGTMAPQLAQNMPHMSLLSQSGQNRISTCPLS